MANFDEIIKHYSDVFVSFLKEYGITRSVYRRTFGTSFAARILFFERIASVEQVRSLVRKQMLLDEYAESLTPVEMIFIENYNNIASFLNLPLYEKDNFLQDIKKQQDYPYYGSRLYFIANRAELFAQNSHITALVKNSKTFNDAKDAFEEIVKDNACMVIADILRNADRLETFWA